MIHPALNAFRVFCIGGRQLLARRLTTELKQVELFLQGQRQRLKNYSSTFGTWD